MFLALYCINQKFVIFFESQVNVAVVVVEVLVIFKKRTLASSQKFEKRSLLNELTNPIISYLKVLPNISPTKMFF